MTRYQESKNTMYMVVDNYLNEADPAVLAMMPDFLTLFTDYKSELRDLQKYVKEQETLITGFRKEKFEHREKMIAVLLFVSTRIRAYAWSIGDQVLDDKASIAPSRLLRMSDTIVLSYAKKIHDLADEHLAALAPFGVDAAKLTELLDAHEAFRNWIPLTRAAIVNRKQMTKMIAQTIRTIDGLLTGMDKLVRTMQFVNFDFFDRYFDSRIIVNNATRRLSLRGWVYNEANQPILKAVVAIPSLGVSTKTTAKGEFEFRGIKGGMYTVEFSRSGYDLHKEVVVIVDNERTDVKVVLKDAERVAEAS